jgi:hypothetical protein
VARAQASYQALKYRSHSGHVTNYFSIFLIAHDLRRECIRVTPLVKQDFEKPFLDDRVF